MSIVMPDSLDMTPTESDGQSAAFRKITTATAHTSERVKRKVSDSLMHNGSRKWAYVVYLWLLMLYAAPHPYIGAPNAIGV